MIYRPEAQLRFYFANPAELHQSALFAAWGVVFPLGLLLIGLWKPVLFQASTAKSKFFTGGTPPAHQRGRHLHHLQCQHRHRPPRPGSPPVAGFPLYNERVENANRWAFVDAFKFKIPVPFTFASTGLK
jgi:hypothetical protein